MAIPARDRGNENSAMLIAVWEPDDSRWPVIEDICTACGACPHRLAGTRPRAAIVERGNMPPLLLPWTTGVGLSSHHRN
jgi:hypothetical protein